MNKITAVILSVLVVLISALPAYADTVYDAALGHYVITIANDVNCSDKGTESNVEIYVPDCEDDVPFNSAVPLSMELQEYIWTKCKRSGISNYDDYYCFVLAVIQQESCFKVNAYAENGNGTKDRGIMQINSCWIKTLKAEGLIQSSEDLYDPKKCIDCGIWNLNQCIQKFGVSESAYFMYNTGKEKAGSNKSSRKVWKYYQEWKALLFGGTE